MTIAPLQLQHAFEATTGARASLARMQLADRGPSWVRVLDAGRTSRTWMKELDSRATELHVGNANATPDLGIDKAVDYLHGAAWHGNRALDAVDSTVADALSGHAELQAAARKLLDPSQPVDMYTATGTFESAVKHVDPSLLDKIGSASHAGADELVRATSDVEAARSTLRGVARYIHP